MKILWLALVIVVACVLPMSAQQQETLSSSGNAFVTTCSDADKENYRSAQELVNLASCTGFVNGFVHGFGVGVLYSGEQLNRKVAPLFCVPDEVGAVQSVRVLLKYIRDNPKDAHHPTASLLMVSFQTAYPCK